MTASRWVWAWTVPAAVVGWIVAGALVPSAIQACGWVVIESGVVSERVWRNSVIILVITTVIAMAWVLAYSFWTRRRGARWIVDSLLCLGFGATAWALPFAGLGYTLGDHWDGMQPAVSDETCGLDLHPLGVLLVGGGIAAIFGWVVFALIAALARRGADSDAVSRLHSPWTYE